MTTSISDRARFYLKHRKQIEEWAKLEREVRVEAHLFYSSLAEPLLERASTLSREPSLHVSLDGGNPPKLFLHLPSWREGKGAPSAGIGLEWPTKPMFHNSYTGVWLRAGGSHKERAAALHGAIVRRLEAEATFPLHRTAHPGDYVVSGKYWPCYRFERFDGDVWTDEGLAAFHQQLIEQIAWLWENTHAHVDAALRENPV